MLFWDVAPWRLVDEYQHFKGQNRLYSEDGGKQLLQNVTAYYISTKLLVVTSQETVIFIFTDARS